MRRSLRLIARLGGGLILIVALVLTAASRRGSPSWIIYTVGQGSPPNPHSLIYRMRPDGSDVQVISAPARGYAYLAWSPDGRYISFTWYQESVISSTWARADYFIQPDPRRSVLGGGVRWSPDGRRVIYAGWDSLGDPEHGRSNLRRMSVDQTEVQRLTDRLGLDGPLAWSPDGQWIVFESDYEGDRAIYRMRPDGTGEQRLIVDPDMLSYIEYSPDDQWLLFTSKRSGTYQIYRMRPDGTGVQRLTDPPASHTEPTWSPDGQWIAFRETHNDQDTIYRMRPDGSDQQPLLTMADRTGVIEWSPDGRWLLLANGADGQGSQLYRVRPDGTDLQLLTPQPALYRWATWSPLVRREGQPWHAVVIGAALLAISLIHRRRR